MIRSEEYWRRLPIEHIATKTSRQKIKITLLEAQRDIIELHVLLRLKNDATGDKS